MNGWSVGRISPWKSVETLAQTLWSPGSCFSPHHAPSSYTFSFPGIVCVFQHQMDWRKGPETAQHSPPVGVKTTRFLLHPDILAHLCLTAPHFLLCAPHLALFWGVWPERLHPAGSRTGPQRQLPFTSLPGVWKNPKVLETSESFTSTSVLSLFDPCCCLTKFLMRKFQNYVDICRVSLPKLPGNWFKYSKWVI